MLRCIAAQAPRQATIANMGSLISHAPAPAVAEPFAEPAAASKARVWARAPSTARRWLSDMMTLAAGRRASWALRLRSLSLRASSAAAFAVARSALAMFCTETDNEITVVPMFGP